MAIMKQGATNKSKIQIKKIFSNEVFTLSKITEKYWQSFSF